MAIGIAPFLSFRTEEYINFTVSGFLFLHIRYRVLILGSLSIGQNMMAGFGYQLRDTVGSL